MIFFEILKTAFFGVALVLEHLGGLADLAGDALETCAAFGTLYSCGWGCINKHNTANRELEVCGGLAKRWRRLFLLFEKTVKSIRELGL